MHGAQSKQGLGGYQAIDALTAHLLGRVGVEHGQTSRIDIQDRAVGCEYLDAFRLRIEHGSQAPLTVGELLCACLEFMQQSQLFAVSDLQLVCDSAYECTDRNEEREVSDPGAPLAPGGPVGEQSRAQHGTE